MLKKGKNLLLLLALLLVPESVLADDNNNLLIGKWRGTYACAQGLTNVEMEVKPNFRASYRFWNIADYRYGSFDGIFFGTLKHSHSNVVFNPDKTPIDSWYKAPSNYISWHPVGFDGRVNIKKLTIEGNVFSSRGGCKNISLRKIKIPA
jgi:hypothetical protein